LKSSSESWLTFSCMDLWAGGVLVDGVLGGKVEVVEVVLVDRVLGGKVLGGKVLVLKGVLGVDGVFD